MPTQPQPPPLDLVIVGAGPAGLAAAHAFAAAAPDPSGCLLLDAGSSLDQRSRHAPGDIASGVGGAGLYSDGKFSFYPSATRLWQLPDQTRLLQAYGWLQRLLAQYGLQTPPFPHHDHDATHPAPTQPTGSPREACFKPYPSLAMDLPKRRLLIQHLHQPFHHQTQLQTRLVDLHQLQPSGLLRLDLQGQDGAATEPLFAWALVLAGGRFGPLSLSRWSSPPPTRFMRVELGVRLEGPHDHPFFQDLLKAGGSIDPKLLIDPDAPIQWRTFCCCVQGEIVTASFDGLHVLSGRADGLPGQRSNIGFNLRLLTPPASDPIEPLRHRPPFRLPLTRALAEPSILDPIHSPWIAGHLRQGLRRLGQLLPGLHQGQGDEGIWVHGPALEGVGRYPVTDPDLKFPSMPVYVPGDASGKFRGLVAALLSGAYVGGLAAHRASAPGADPADPGQPLPPTTAPC